MQRQAQELLEHISGLSSAEAKEKLIQSLKDEAKTAAASYINDIMDDAKLTANKEAKRIVVQSIQRVADLCKVNFYTVDYRNAKNADGVWEKVPYYTISDSMPYGHGEKSVYIISGYLYGENRLSREEAFAIRYMSMATGTPWRSV